MKSIREYKNDIKDIQCKIRDLERHCSHDSTVIMTMGNVADPRDGNEVLRYKLSFCYICEKLTFKQEEMDYV